MDILMELQAHIHNTTMVLGLVHCRVVSDIVMANSLRLNDTDIGGLQHRPILTTPAIATCYSAIVIYFACQAIINYVVFQYAW
jgi:hypothetical protein